MPPSRSVNWASGKKKWIVSASLLCYDGLMMIAILMSETTAETGVATAVRVDVVVGVDVVVANVDWHLDVIGHWLLDRDRDVPLNVDWVWTIDGDLYRVRDWSVDGVRDVLLNGVRLWHWNLDWVWHRLFDMNWVRPIDWYLNFVGSCFLDDIWNRSVNWHWNGSWDGHFVWSIDWNGHLVGNLLFNGVGLRNRYLYLDRVRHVLDNLVRFWHSYFDFIWNFLDDFIGLWNTNLDFVRPIDGHMYGIWNLLLNGVRLWNMNWNLDVLLNRVRHMLYHFVGLWNGDLHWVWDALLDCVRNMLLNGIWNWVSFQQGNCFMDIGMTTQVNAMTITAM